MAKVLFFGYGEYRNRSKLAQVIGHDPGEEVGAVLNGYILVYQSLKQIPENLRKFLQDVFGNDFKAYSIKKGNGLVSGVIWELEEKDLKTLKEWVFVGDWREMAEVVVTSSGGKEVTALTDKARDSQQFEKVIDGVDYEEFNNSRIPKIDYTKQEQYTQEQISKIRAWLSQESNRK